jgi:hypothetical protein
MDLVSVVVWYTFGSSAPCSLCCAASYGYRLPTLYRVLKISFCLFLFLKSLLVAFPANNAR